MADKIKNIFSYEPKKYAIVAILLAIVVLGVTLRFYRLGYNSLLADEFLDMNSAYGYFKTGIWQAWDFNLDQPSEIDIYSERDERAWIYKWQVAQLFHMFPPTETVARSVSAIWGISTIFIIYWAASYFTRRRAVGLIAAFLFTINMTAIVYDRKLRMYAMFYPVYLLLSLFLYQFFEADYMGRNRLTRYFYDKLEINLYYFIPLVLALLVSFSIQQLTVNIVPVFLAYVAIVFIVRLIAWQKIRKYLLVILGVVAVAGAIYLFVPKETVNFYYGHLKFFIDNEKYFDIVLRDYRDQTVVAALTISGILFMLWKRKFRQVLWISLSFIIPLLLAAYVWKHSTGTQIIFAFESFLIILLAAGIFFWAELFRRIIGRWLSSFGTFIALSIIVAALAYVPDYSEFRDDDNTYHRKPDAVANYRKSFAEIKENLKPGDAVITRNFRNYYLSGAGVPVLEFGGERAEKLPLEAIKEFQEKYSRIWVVLFDNDLDHVSKKANKYIKTSFTKIEDSRDKKNTRIHIWDGGT